MILLVKFFLLIILLWYPPKECNLDLQIGIGKLTMNLLSVERISSCDR